MKRLLPLALIASVLALAGCATAPRFVSNFHPPVLGDVKISALPGASSLTGSEVVPMVQSATTVGGTLLQFKTYIDSSLISGTPTAGHCAEWFSATVLEDSGSGCGGGGSMTWPSVAGIPNYSGSSSWGTSYSASNEIPDSFIGGLAGSPTSGQFWGYNGTSQGWYTPSGSGITIQTGGTNNSSQTLLNFTAGSGISVSNPSGGVEQVGVTYSIRTVSGTSDTILSTDCANGVKYTSSSAVAVTLPQATGTFSTCNTDIIAAGTGTVTVTPTTSTINGSSSLAVAGSRSANITADSGNYDAAGTALLGSGSTTTIASGTAALGTSAITSGACAAAVTVSASGVATTDAVIAGFNGDPTSTTGFIPSTSGMLTIIAYPSANDVNFKVCNDTASSVTPGAVTLNWRVVR